MKTNKKLTWAARIFPLLIAIFFSFTLLFYTHCQHQEKIEFFTTNFQQISLAELQSKIAAFSIDLKIYSKLRDKDIYQTIEEQVNKRLELAQNIIRNIYTTNKDLSSGKITAKIVNTFNRLHHQNSDRYFFLCKADGTPILSPQIKNSCEGSLAWDLKQTNLLPQADDLTPGQYYREQKLRRWWLAEPDRQKNGSLEKIGKVFFFSPLELLVGTSNNVNSVRAIQEQKLLNWIEEVYAKEFPRFIIFDKMGTIQISSGFSLAPGDNIHLADWYLLGKPLEFSLIKKTRKIDKTVTLTSKKKGEAENFNLQILPEWNWVVMTPVNTDEAALRLQDKLTIIHQENTIKLFLLAGVCSIIILLVAWGTLRINRKTGEFLSEKLLYNDLTDLPNLAHFMMQTEPLLKKEKAAFIVNIDIDNFSHINERYSRDTGDMLLRQIAARLRSIFPSKLLCHTDADEFLLLLPHSPTKDHCSKSCLTRGKMRELRTLFSQPFFLEDCQAEVSFSSGCCGKNTESLSLEELIRRANIALFRAKSEGQNSHICYNDIEEQIERGRMLAELFPAAISGEDVSVVYQPICVVEDGDMVFRLEALSRWLHPELGNITPQEFIPIAEKNGFMLPFSRFLVEKICLDLIELKEKQGKTPVVSIHISSRQLLSSEFIESITSIIGKYNIPRSRIVLEIKEKLLSENIETILPIMNKLQQEGLEMTLDDFGAGASSLNHLNRVPVKELKISRSFIAGLPKDEESIALVRSIIAIAAANNLLVVAEGVENKNQKEWLIQEGCNIMQGFFCTIPLTFEQLLKWYKNKTPFFVEENK